MSENEMIMLMCCACADNEFWSGEMKKKRFPHSAFVNFKKARLIKPF